MYYATYYRPTQENKPIQGVLSTRTSEQYSGKALIITTMSVNLNVKLFYKSEVI